MAFGLGVVLLASNADAYVFGGTNFGFMGYPDASCRRPYSKPVEPYNPTSQYEIDSYNSQVDQYNATLSRYQECVNEYVDNAKNDIKRITEKANALIDEERSL